VNSLQRIMAAVAFQPPDRVPVITQVFGHAAFLAGAPLRQYLCDGEVLADCQLQALRYYEHDAVFALMDVYVEAEALGSVLSYNDKQYPFVHSHALQNGVNFEKLSLPDPSRSGRMPQLIKAATLLREAIGEEVIVVGCVVGPMTLATQLMGIEAALFAAADDPEHFARVLVFCKNVIVQFGLAQLEAGVHLPIVFDPSASATLIPPQFFREFELPLLAEIFTAFRQAGAAANWLHITGMTEPILGYYPQCGADIVNVDYLVELSKAKELLPGVCINGNIKPLSFVQSTPRDIACEAKRLLELFSDRGGYILSPGCEIPLEAKPENVAALVAAAR
jgi:uroporphyrinogen decarboxylase